MLECIRHHPAVSFEHHDNWVVQHVLDSWSCASSMSIFSQSEDVRLYVCPLSWPLPFWIWRGKNMFRDPKGLSLKTTQKVTRNQLQSLIQETGALLPRRSPDQWSSDSTQDMWSTHISKTGVRTYINYTSWLDQRHPSPRNPKKSFRRRHDIYLHPATITYILYILHIFNMMLEVLFYTAFSLRPFNGGLARSKLCFSTRIQSHQPCVSQAKKRDTTKATAAIFQPQLQRLRTQWEPPTWPRHHSSIFLSWLGMGGETLMARFGAKCCCLSFLLTAGNFPRNTAHWQSQTPNRRHKPWRLVCCLLTVFRILIFKHV